MTDVPLKDKKVGTINGTSVHGETEGWDKLLASVIRRGECTIFTHNNRNIQIYIASYINICYILNNKFASYIAFNQRKSVSNYHFV